jgi:hypothetical protein
MKKEGNKRKDRKRIETERQREELKYIRHRHKELER